MIQTSGGGQKSGHQSPLWVKSGHVQCVRSFPLLAISGHRSRPQTNTATRGRITLISVNSPGCVLLKYNGHGPLLETTRGLERAAIGAIAVAQDRP